MCLHVSSTTCYDSCCSYARNIDWYELPEKRDLGGGQIPHTIMFLHVSSMTCSEFCCCSCAGTIACWLYWVLCVIQLGTIRLSNGPVSLHRPLPSCQGMPLCTLYFTTPIFPCPNSDSFSSSLSMVQEISTLQVFHYKR